MKYKYLFTYTCQVLNYRLQYPSKYATINLTEHALSHFHPNYPIPPSDVEVHGNVYAENDPRSDTQQRADSMVQRSLLQSLSRSDPISLAGGAAVFTTDPVHRPESVLTRSSGGADYTSGQATETETEGRGSVVKASASPQVQAAAPDENSSSELETESETESETDEDEPSVKGAQK